MGFRRGLRGKTGLGPLLRKPDRNLAQKPGSADPGPVSYGEGRGREAAMERREAPAFSKGNAAKRKTGAPLGAPLPRIFAGVDSPGPPARE